MAFGLIELVTAITSAVTMLVGGELRGFRPESSASSRCATAIGATRRRGPRDPHPYMGKFSIVSSVFEYALYRRLECRCDREEFRHVGEPGTCAQTKAVPNPGSDYRTAANHRGLGGLTIERRQSLRSRASTRTLRLGRKPDHMMRAAALGGGADADFVDHEIGVAQPFCK
jgi:hypothetical protein